MSFKLCFRHGRHALHACQFLIGLIQSRASCRGVKKGRQKRNTDHVAKKCGDAKLLVSCKVKHIICRSENAVFFAAASLYSFDYTADLFSLEKILAFTSPQVVHLNLNNS